MRTIKFRVWIYDKQIEDGYLNDEYYQFHRDNEGYYVYEDWRDSEDGRSRRCIPMQFTGLHDKNGKEIFEGDVLLHDSEGQFTIVWDNDFVGFAAKTEGSNTIDLIHAPYFRQCKIIGNIHENPELLNPS